MIVIALIAITQEAVTVPVGETLRVELQDVSTTGYRWDAQDFDGSLIKLEGSAVQAGPAPGASGTRRFDFRALTPGRTVIHFSLSRPWEKNAAALKQAQVAVTVK